MRRAGDLRRRTKPARAKAGQPARAARAPGKRFCVVGIGASAGGLEATATLLAALPADCGLAIVIVQHLDPTHRSQATEILARRTGLVVETARDGMRVEANHVYTIPSDRDAHFEGERLRLLKQPAKRLVHLPVDRLFRSLGEQFRERAIGVVLSGTGSDGSLGLEAIIAHGGIVLVQEPGSARFNGMPSNAIATGEASGVLPIADMPAVLCQYARHPYAAASGDAGLLSATDAAPLERILAALRTAHSLDFSGYKRSMLLRRIERRMGLRQIVTLADYASLLAQQPGELDALRRDLLIGVTGFFRDPEAWRVLEKNVVEPLVASRRPGESVRAWVAGTATGEEAYSLGMLLLETSERLGRPCELRVFATDASEEAIAFARRGRYPAGIVEQVPADRLHRFFDRVEGDQQFQVKPQLRACVTFGSQKLLDDPPFSRLDLICCRNLLIYLEPEAQRKVLGLLQQALHPGGFLFLGTAESAGPAAELMRPVSRSWRIYRRAGAERPAPALLTDPAPGTQTTAAPAASSGAVRNQPRDLTATAEQILLGQYCAAAFLVNAAGEVVYLYGHTEPYLARRAGAPSHDLLKMLRADLRTPVRRALRRISRQEVDTVVEDIRVRRERALIDVRMSVVPANGARVASRLWLVILQDVPLAPPPTRRMRGTLSRVVRQLEDELRSAQHDLRSGAEQMEQSTQDLRASNEELVAVNEELQVANEELQSSREELKSLNEELLTVNQQLQSKVAELEASAYDLKNLLDSSQVIAVCFDRHLRVRWFAPAAGTAFRLGASDIGRAMSTLADAPIGEGAIADAERVLSGQLPPPTEQFWKQRWFARRLLPYRVAGDKVDGVILTLADITEAREAAGAQLAEKTSLAAALKRGIAERTETLRELSVALTLAEERERRAIAADLHDDLGQTLALMKMKVDQLLKKMPTGAVADELRSVAVLLLQSSDRVRSLAFQLSSAILHDLGLVPALEWLAEEMARLYSLSVRIDADSAARQPLDMTQRTLLFRAVRELLINVARHAATDVAGVKCRRTKDRLVIVVSDSGKGFDPAVAFSGSASRGFGLRSVRERLAALGGTMECESILGDGSRVTLSCPAVPPMQPARSG